MAIEYNFTLDMDRSKRDNNIAYARTGDIDSIVINADLVFGGAAYTPSGTNAFFECITPNGRSIRAAAEKTGSSVSVEVPPAAFQAAGVINVAYFRFETGASDNPTYVESTEPFAIVVREGIGDNIDAGDYIEEWRKLADQLEAAVAEVKKKAEQAETAIDEQKTEIDQLKAQAQKAIAGDVTEVEGVAQSAISAINKEKADVADAAEDISAAGEQAINSFNSKGTSAINKFNTDSASAISKFNTDGTSAINQFNTNAGSKFDEVDGMITEAQGDVDAAVTQLETATDKAVSAMEDALDGTTAGSLQNAINRTLKLDVADMTNIPDNSSLSSFTNVGSYCCKTAATAATIGDCPIDDSPFNMYVFSSATSGQVMQLVVPIDMNGKPTAEWHVRFGTSSAMDPWSVIGGGADIAAGLGIDITGDAKKTVALDTTAFYQHHEAASIIQGSTEVTGGGRIKELTVYGNTKQNLWQNPSGTINGVTVTANMNGSVTVNGTATGTANPYMQTYALRPGSTCTVSVNEAVQSSNDPSKGSFFLEMHDSDSILSTTYVGYGTTTTVTFAVPDDTKFARIGFFCVMNNTVSGTYRVMLNKGTTAQPWCPPGLNSVDELSIVTTGKNLFNLPSKTDNGITVINNGDGSFTISGESTGIVKVYIDMPATPGMTVYAVKDGVIETEGSVAWSCQVLRGFRNSSGVFSQTRYDSIINTERSFTLAPDENMFRLQIYINGAGLKVFPGTVRVYAGFQPFTEYSAPALTTTPVDLDGHAINSLPDGTRDELRINSTGNVTLVKRTQTLRLDGRGSWRKNESPFLHYTTPWSAFGGSDTGLGRNNVIPKGRCDKLPVDSTVPNGIYSANIDGSTAYLREPTFADDATDVEAWIGTNAPTVIMPLATPQEIDLPGIAIPSLASPSYMIYASSDVPAEIEADVVKVDYLPPSDAYTKQEVDRKIQDAGMPSVVPVSKGGTGVTTAAAERNRLGLGNTTGPLPVANGGTGKTAAKAAQNALLADIDTVSYDVGDDAFFVGYYQSPSDATGALYKRVGSNVWNWIVSKIRSTFGFSSSNVLPVANGGTGLTKAPSMLVNLESASAANPLASDPRPGVLGELPLTRGGTGGTSAAAARTNLGVYSKAEVDGKVPKVVYGTGNIPSNAENGTIYIQYRS